MKISSYYESRRCSRFPLYTTLFIMALLMGLVLVAALSSNRHKYYLDTYVVDNVPRDSPLTGIVILKCENKNIMVTITGLKMEDLERLYNGGKSLKHIDRTREVKPFPKPPFTKLYE